MEVVLIIIIFTAIAVITAVVVIDDITKPNQAPTLQPPNPESDNPDAVFAYGLKLRDRGDYTESTRLIKVAAERGSSAACLKISTETYQPEEKFKWKIRAAELGNTEAMVWLIDAFINGHGVLKSIAKSTQWLIRAAEAGDHVSMLKLADAYAVGYGVKHSPIESLAWLYVAEFRGSAKAKSIMKSSEKQINPALVQLAQERAQTILDLIGAGKTTADSVDNGAGALPQASSPAAVKPNRKPSGSGSGAVVSSEGHVVTAAHVVKGASYIEVVTPSGAKSAVVLSIDNHNDIALLKIEGSFENSIPIGRASEVRLGQTVSTIGFPNIGIQGQSPKVTQGMISGENGIQNDIRFWQISVPIQPGNSGGPLLNDKGELVGLIVATLGLKAIEITGTVPQNVNYAIKGNYLEPMLNVHKVASTGQSSTPSDFQDMIAQAQKASVLILVY